MSSFFELLDKRAKTTLLCVGLDPRSKNAADAERECIAIINATADYAAAFKPNAAFFEAHGPEGWSALRRVVKAVPQHIPVILDAKRGDIADTAAAYAASAFRDIGANAITLSPYMGKDSMAPFLQYPGKGAFVLCKTSNKGSADLQDLKVHDGTTLFEHVARKAEHEWSTPANRNIGLVVGATHPEAMAKVRAAAPSLWFLVPGVGAQGGDLATAMKAGLRRDGSGMLINVSRAIGGAKDPRAAAAQWCAQMNAARVASSSSRAVVSNALMKSQCVKFGSFTLKSGKKSPIYIDLRRLVGFPDVLAAVAKEYAKVLSTIEHDCIVGLPYAALPIATAISLETGKPLVYPRREAKAYGTQVPIEGVYKKGDRAVIIDDLVTTGETKTEAIEKLTAAGLRVVSIVVLIDREMGATEFLGSRGYDFKAVASLTDILADLKASKTITDAQFGEATAFIKASKPQSKL